MISRCFNPNNRRFADYGSRGITVCRRWLKFENFYADMGPKPKGLTLERKNNAKGYSKGNCCWATQKEQAANRRVRRDTVMVMWKGKLRRMPDVAKELGINRATVVSRMCHGAPVLDALTAPLRPGRRKS